MKRRLSSQAMMILTVIVISCGATTEVKAGTITARELRGTCGTLSAGDPDVPTNLVKSFTQLCSMDILFTVMNSPTTPTVRHDFTELVRNFSMPDWFDFHMQLGFGTGTQFTPADQNCVVGFTNTPQPTASPGVFTVQGVGSNRIDWAGRLRRSNDVTFTFSVNVQDLSPCVPIGSRLASGNGYEFTLRQTPTIPEPATMLLLGTGVAGVAMKMRKRLKKSRQSQGRN